MNTSFIRSATLATALVTHNSHEEFLPAQSLPDCQTFKSKDSLRQVSEVARCPRGIALQYIPYDGYDHGVTELQPRD